MRTLAPDEPAHAGRIVDAMDAQTRGEALERCARTDAHHLVETLQYLHRHLCYQGADQPLVRGMVTAHQPTSYVEQMHYLERAARYVRAARRRQAVQQL